MFKLTHNISFITLHINSFAPIKFKFKWPIFLIKLILCFPENNLSIVELVLRCPLALELKELRQVPPEQAQRVTSHFSEQTKTSYVSIVLLLV